MKISFSRKGFDSAAGGAPSPIIGGRPISLPIPTQHRSQTTYDDVGLGQIVSQATRGKVAGSDLCHRDPMFQDGRCAFGQIAAAQSHLANQEFGIGDVFLFFGLFADESCGERHHRIFGYLRVSEAISLGAEPACPPCFNGFEHRHPHTLGTWNDNNTLYFGRGNVARTASRNPRLSKAKSVGYWHIPDWLPAAGLSYHSNPLRWAVDGELKACARGQEFVTGDIAGNVKACRWVNDVIAEIDGD